MVYQLSTFQDVSGSIAGHLLEPQWFAGSGIAEWLRVEAQDLMEMHFLRNSGDKIRVMLYIGNVIGSDAGSLRDFSLKAESY